MDLNTLHDAFLSNVPEEIKNDSKRLSDFLLGAEAMRQFLSNIFGDDLK